MILAIFFVALVSVTHAARFNDRDNCQLVKVSRCADFNYNYTLYPNLLMHQRQDDAESDLRQYDLLVQSECSPHLRFFLCVLFVPVCTVLNKPLPPCRYLCEQVRAGCETLLNRYGFQWPEQFYCSRFPRSKDDICVGNPQAEKGGQIEDKTKPTTVTGKDGSVDGEEGQHVIIKCTAKGTTVHIRKVRHSGGSLCKGRSTRNILTSICNGKDTCSFILNDITLKGHCHGKVGRSKIKFKCTKGGVRSLSAQRNGRLQMSCKKRREIRILKAAFGEGKCRTPHAHCVLSQLCNGNKSCDIIADQNRLDSPCTSPKARLLLQYECIRRPDAPIQTASIDGGKILTIPSCPMEKKLSIIHAKYGESGRCQMYCVVFALCNGKPSCIIPNMAQFRRSCPGSSRKLEVRYQCV
eukprot:gene11344-21534_t